MINPYDEIFVPLNYHQYSLFEVIFYSPKVVLSAFLRHFGLYLHIHFSFSIDFVAYWNRQSSFVHTLGHHFQLCFFHLFHRRTSNPVSLFLHFGYPVIIRELYYTFKDRVLLIIIIQSLIYTYLYCIFLLPDIPLETSFLLQVWLDAISF